MYFQRNDFLLRSVLSASMLLCSSLARPSESWIPVLTSATCDFTSVSFSSFNEGIIAGSRGCVYVTHDGGTTWLAKSTGHGESFMTARSLDSKTAYVARLGLYRTLNAGAVWEGLGSFGVPDSILDLYVADINHLFLIKGGAVLSSDDGGQTYFERVSPIWGVDPDRLHFPTATTGFVTGGTTDDTGSRAVLLKSTDSGTHWSNVPVSFSQVTASDFFNSETGIVATIDGSMWTTSDGASSWSLLPSTPPSDEIVTGMDHGTNGLLFGITLTGKIYTTGKNASIWNLEFTDGRARSLNAVSSAFGRHVAVGNAGLIVRDDRIFSSQLESW